MTADDWVDCSNYSGVPTAEQVDAIRAAGYGGVVMGLQSSFLNPFCADQQSQAFKGFAQEFYVDVPGRRLDLCEPRSMCWIDIETGCFEDADLVRAEVARIKAAGLRPGIYTNEGGMQNLGLTTEFGSEFGSLPLWYANPDLVAFKPFCGWTFMTMWQRTSTTTIAGFTLDLNTRLPANPPAPLPDWKDVAGAGADAAIKLRRGEPLKTMLEADKAILRDVVSLL